MSTTPTTLNPAGSTLYIPSGATNMREAPLQQIRLALIGAPKSGKTEAALTFPNPIVVDFDNGLTQHRGDNLVRIPFCDINWVKSQGFPNARDGFVTWLTRNGPSFSPDQTLVVDSWTTLQDAHDIQKDKEPLLSEKTGKVDHFDFWACKLDYAKLVCTMLKSLPCAVVVTFHEQGERDDNGRLTAKLLPLMEGKFKDRLGVYFTDMFRQHAIPVKDATGKVVSTKWRWQVRSDIYFNAGTRIRADKLAPILEDGFYVAADYKIFKY